MTREAEDRAMQAKEDPGPPGDWKKQAGSFPRDFGGSTAL